MLIIYRTNAGFEGQIQDLRETGYGPIFDAWAQQQQMLNLPVDLAYIELDITTVPAATLTDLYLNRSTYSVDPSGPTLLCDGSAVYTAGTQVATPGKIIPVLHTDFVRTVAGVNTNISWAGVGPVSWP